MVKILLLESKKQILNNKNKITNSKNNITDNWASAKTQPFLDLEKPTMNCNHRIPTKNIVHEINSG